MLKSYCSMKTIAFCYFQNCDKYFDHMHIHKYAYILMKHSYGINIKVKHNTIYIVYTLVYQLILALHDSFIWNPSFRSPQRVHIHCRIQFWHICFTPPSLSLSFSLPPSLTHQLPNLSLSLIPFS